MTYFSDPTCLLCRCITFLTVWVNKNHFVGGCVVYYGEFGHLLLFRPAVSKFGSFLRSQPDICEGGVEALSLALTTQWGADESVPSRPFPRPRHHIPSLTRCTDIRKKSSGDSPPPSPQTTTCPPKSTFCTALQWQGLFFPPCPAQVLSSRHSDGPYCTARQKKRQPSLWATDRPCLDWKDFDGVKQGGGCSAEKLVSPGQPLWLSVPAQSSPYHPTFYPFPFFLPFIGCSQASILSKGGLAFAWKSPSDTQGCFSLDWLE